MAGEGFAILILLIVAILGALIWTAIVQDEVGWRPKKRRVAAGLQGRTTDWLHQEALLTAPDPRRMREGEISQLSGPTERGLNAVISREAFQRDIPLADAYDRLHGRVKAPLLLAFLDGKMRRAVRIHWRSRYRGPDVLFLPWYYAVAYPRYGRRHLFLETLSAVLKEFRTQ